VDIVSGRPAASEHRVTLVNSEHRRYISQLFDHFNGTLHFVFNTLILIPTKMFARYRLALESEADQDAARCGYAVNEV